MKDLKRKSLWTLFVFGLLGFLSCSDSNSLDQHGEIQNDEGTEKSEFGNKYGGELTPINSTDYSRYLLAENTSKEYVLSSITEYGQLNRGTIFAELVFGFTEYKNWILVKIPDSLGFYEFHNLVGWLWGFGQEEKLPTMTYGIALHKSDSTKSYFTELDQNTHDGDVLVGAFENGNSLYVFLPQAYQKNGNMKITTEINCDFDSVKEKFSEFELPFEEFDSQTYENYGVKFYE